MHISLQFLAFKPRSKSVGDGDSGVALSLSSSLKSSSYDADHLDSTSSQVKSDRFQYSQSHDTTVSSSSIPGAPTANSPPSLSLHTKPMNTPVAPLYSVNTPSVPLCVVSKVNAHPVFDDITSNFTLVPDISDGLDRLSVQSVDTPRTEDFEAAFQETLVKHFKSAASPFQPSDTDTVTSEFVQQKIKASGAEDIFSTAGTETLDEMSDMEQDKSRFPTSLRNGGTTSHANASNRYNHQLDDSSESDVDSEMAREIREESQRIQKEIELERKANQIKEKTPIKSDKSALKTRETTPNSRDVASKSQDLLPARSDDALKFLEMRPESSANKSAPDMSNGRRYRLFQSPDKSHSKTQKEDGEIIQKLNNEKIRLLGEISELQRNMRNIEENLSSSMREAKENKAKADEARSQMMLAEFKKDSALKEFTQLSNELERGRQLQAALQLDSANRIPITGLPSTSSGIGVSSAELSDLLSERNQLRAIVENRNSTSQMEIKELEQQLDNTKQQLYAEQRTGRQKLETLEAKVGDMTSQLAQLSMEKETKSLELDSFRAKNHKLEQNYRELEKSRLEAIMEKDRELEVLKETTQRDSLELKMKSNSEINNAKQLAKIAEEKVMKLQVEIQHRDELNQDLREECNLLQSKTVDEEQSHDETLREMNNKLAALQEQKRREMDVLKSQMELEHLSVIEVTRAELETQHSEVLGALKQDYDSQISQQQTLINGKEEEICLLRSRLSQQEDATRKLAERLKADSQIQLEQAVQSERHMWEKERQHVEESQLKIFREEAEKQEEQLRDQIENEKRRCRQLDDQYRALKSELEDQRQQNQKLYEEKLAAVSKSKQAAQEETNIQLEKIRQQLEEDTERVLEKLKSELTLKDEEIRTLRSECQNLQQSEADASIALEKLEKLLVTEINDECRKTAHLLGVTPRKAQSSGLAWMNSSAQTGNHRRSRSITASAIANLRACNEELRNNVKELKEDVDALNGALYKSKKVKEVELDEIRKQMSRDKGHDMDDLRVRLTQEHKEQIDHICSMVIEQGKLSRLLHHRDRKIKDIHQHMDSWKEETADKMANRFTEELHNQLKVYLSRLERKLTDHTLKKSLKDSVTKPKAALDYNDNMSIDDLQASPQLRKSVQSRIKELRRRSPSRKQTSLSTPNLSLMEDSTSTMGQRVKLAELKAHLAEERAARNQALLNNKLQEVNQLQNTLNSQTKEIISLERSFEELKHASFSPPGPSSHMGRYHS